MKSSQLKRVLFCVTGLLFVGVAAYVWREALLIGVAKVWIVNQPATNADAVVVLGGGLHYRAIAAAHLFHTGLCRTVLIVNVGLNPSEEIGVTEPEHVLIRRFLLKNSVPDTAIVEVGNQSQNTWDDLEAAKAWARAQSAHRLIIPTDLFHTRRLRWVCNRVLGESGISAAVVALNPRDYSERDWWKHETGVIAFQNEVIKLGFYVMKHRSGPEIGHQPRSEPTSDL
jgi:uncharacterized SAM-binding protein YcdF (DUF218 family)